MSEPTAYASDDEAILAMEAPLRHLAATWNRAQLLGVLQECLDDVYEADEDE